MKINYFLNFSQALVAHTYNSSYSGDSDQEDRSSKPETLSQKYLSQKEGLVEWLKVKALSSSPRTTKKERN
jgi:hypothetical protein